MIPAPLGNSGLSAYVLAMRIGFLSFGLPLFAVAFAQAAWAGPAREAGSPREVRPVVLELFTSEGCSDCPAADVLLTELAKRKDVIALSLPITYWDMLGWKDTFATEGNTQRQKAYARALNRSGIYTPQMIVDGTLDVVGNQRDHVVAAISARVEAMQEYWLMPLVGFVFDTTLAAAGVSLTQDGTRRFGPADLSLRMRGEYSVQGWTLDVDDLTARSGGTNGLTLSGDRKSTRLNSSHMSESRMPSSA